jgi:cold shock CspA family protein
MLLPVQVSFRNIHERAALEPYVLKEAARLERFYKRISSCRVMVERPQRATSGKLFHVRIDVGVPDGELVVRHAPTLHGTLQHLKEQRSRQEADSVLLQKNPLRAIHEAFQEMSRQLQDYARRQRRAVKTKEGLQEGTVKEILQRKGFGFLETEEGREVYFQESAVLQGHFPQLRTGMRVKFVEEMGEKGPQASTVRMIHPRKQVHIAASFGVLTHKPKAEVKFTG